MQDRVKRFASEEGGRINLYTVFSGLTVLIFGTMKDNVHEKCSKRK